MCEICENLFKEKDLGFLLNDSNQHAHIECLEKQVGNLRGYFQTINDRNLMNRIFIIHDGKKVSLYSSIKKGLKEIFGKETYRIELAEWLLTFE